MEKKDLVHNRNKRYLSPPSKLLGEDTCAALSSPSQVPSVVGQAIVMTTAWILGPYPSDLAAAGMGASVFPGLLGRRFLPPLRHVEDISS